MGVNMKKKKSPPKMSGLVLAALRNLRDARGSTAKEIMKYIMAEYNASEATVQRQLKTALKRGVEYGILKKTTNGYSLNTDAEVIGPLDLNAQVDACRKKRPSCKPKRKPSCPKKKKKRSSCCPKPKRRCPKKRKKNPCNVCATRNRNADCNAPVRMLKEDTPTLDDDLSSHGQESDKRSIDDDAEKDATGNSGHRSRSNSKTRTAQDKSRSPSANQSMSDDDDDL